MENEPVLFEGNLALDIQLDVDDFLEYLGELIAQEYSVS